jgi:hypothetical protein
MQVHERIPEPSLEAILAADTWARETAARVAGTVAGRGN